MEPFLGDAGWSGCAHWGWGWDLGSGQLQDLEVMGGQLWGSPSESPQPQPKEHLVFGEKEC